MASTKPPEAADPFDVDALRATPPTVNVAEHVLLTVSVRRPNRREFFRVNPDPAYTIDGTVIEHEDSEGKHDFWLPPALRGLAIEDAKPVRIFTCMSRGGVLFLWPARLPSGDGAGRTWHASALQAADMARGAWIKLQGNRLAGAYEAFRATGELGEPQWPDKPLSELLRQGFDGRVIDGPNHDVLRMLRGEL